MSSVGYGQFPDGPPLGKLAPSGGSAVREATSVGAIYPSEAIWEAIEPGLPGFSVEVLAQIDSTNSELMRRARAGRLEPILLVAEAQTAGRGRLDRAWHSAGAAHRAAGLTFSLGLPLAPQDWLGLSLCVGLCVAESLHPELLLKWPNDVWWQERKLAGILIETAHVGEQRYAVIGVGLNIGPVPADTAAGLRTAPAWLQELLPEVDAPAALLRLAPALVRGLQVFETHGFAPFQSRFQARDALQGLTVSLSDGSTGVAQGVDARGALRVQTAQGVISSTSSEVSVRPVVPPSYGDL